MSSSQNKSLIIMFLTGCWLGSPALANETPQPPPDPWKQAASGQLAEAYLSFSAIAEDSEEILLGKALTLLNKQPRTRTNLEAARALFEKLTASGNEDIAIFSQFFLGRMDEYYENPPRYDRAQETFLTLLKNRAGHPMAEQAATELVFINLYTAPSKEEREKRFETLEKLAESLKSRSGKVNFHLAMGQAYVDFEVQPQKALEHFLAADQLGIARWQVEADVWIAIAEIARAVGNADLAIQYYEKFLKKYQRDNRHYTVAQHLKTLIPETTSH